MSAAGPVRADVLWHLARLRGAADRRRSRLVVAAVAGSGAFLLGAASILAVDGDESVLEGGPAGLAPYIAQSGLRGGTAAGAALLVVPFVLFGVQALRTGTAARERRLAALSLAGATRSQLRRLAVLEGTRSAVLGAVLSGAVFLGLWLVLGVAVPRGARMLPTPGAFEAVVWVVLVVVLTGAGAGAAALAAKPATVTPLGVTRRVPRPLGPAHAVLPVVGILTVVAGFALFRSSSDAVWMLALALVFAGILLFAIGAGPWSVLFAGRVAARRRNLVTRLAGRRMLADVRSPGRVVAVFFTVGGALGFIVTNLVSLLGPHPLDEFSYSPPEDFFYVAGYLAALAGAVLAMTVAAASQVVGATEQVLDSRRSTAVLVALAASPRFVTRVVRRQQFLAVLPPAVLGSLIGWVMSGGLNVTMMGTPASVAISLLVAVAVAALASAAGAVVTARLVRPAVEDAATPDNLRVA